MTPLEDVMRDKVSPRSTCMDQANILSTTRSLMHSRPRRSLFETIRIFMLTMLRWRDLPPRRHISSSFDCVYR